MSDESMIQSERLMTLSGKICATGFDVTKSPAARLAMLALHWESGPKRPSSRGQPAILAAAPYKEPGELVLINTNYQKSTEASVSAPGFSHYRDHAQRLGRRRSTGWNANLRGRRRAGAPEGMAVHTTSSLPGRGARGSNSRRGETAGNNKSSS